ncbi:hypothetical protein ACTPOK_09330 [Streptomyces inhibens]|uniref:hypothetical protein n=1 Tax=Streptomyces inhibens TaxID=2293571 RepID=UPI00402A6EB4
MIHSNSTLTPHQDELAWDLRALDAAASVTDDRAKQHDSSLAIRGFYRSLHLNLTADFRKLGDTTQARTHLAQARDHLDAPNDDGYGQGIRSAIHRLADQLAEEDPTKLKSAETK